MGESKDLEIEMNVVSCFEGIFETFESQNIVHQILMLDELKVEECLHVDEETNMILGPCRA